MTPPLKVEQIMAGLERGELLCPECGGATYSLKSKRVEEYCNCEHPDTYGGYLSARILADEVKRLREALALFKLDGNTLFVRRRTGEEDYPFTWYAATSIDDSRDVSALGSALEPR